MLFLVEKKMLLYSVLSLKLLGSFVGHAAAQCALELT